MGSEVSYLFTLPASGGDAIVDALKDVGPEKSEGYCHSPKERTRSEQHAGSKMSNQIGKGSCQIDRVVGCLQRKERTEEEEVENERDQKKENEENEKKKEPLILKSHLLQFAGKQTW